MLHQDVPNIEMQVHRDIIDLNQEDRSHAAAQSDLRGSNLKQEQEDTSSPNVTLTSQIGLKQAKFGSQPYIDSNDQEEQEDDSSQKKKTQTKKQVSNSNVSTQLLY